MLVTKKLSSVEADNLTAKSPGWILLLPSLMAVPHLSHLVGLASHRWVPLLHWGGHAAGETRLVSPQPMVYTSHVASCWLTPNGGHIASFWLWQIQVQVQVSVCVCVCLHDLCMYMYMCNAKEILYFITSMRQGYIRTYVRMYVGKSSKHRTCSCPPDKDFKVVTDAHCGMSTQSIHTCFKCVFVWAGWVCTCLANNWRYHNRVHNNPLLNAHVCTYVLYMHTFVHILTLKERRQAHVNADSCVPTNCSLLHFMPLFCGASETVEKVFRYQNFKNWRWDQLINSLDTELKG